MKDLMNKLSAFFRKCGKKTGLFFKALFIRVKRFFMPGKEVRSARKAERAAVAESRKYIRAKERQKRKKVTESSYLTQMRDCGNIVEFDNLHTYFFTDGGVVKAVNGVNIDIKKGVTVGVVGESGCGKSISAMSLMRLVQAPQGQIVDGAIRFNAKDGKVYDVTKMPQSDMCKIRGKEISMIFQEPMTSLNPVFTVGSQIDEVMLLHLDNFKKEDAKKRTIEILRQVGIAMPETIYKRYPHQLSGGMRQRIMIAMALACEPRLIIADEPTTALDVTIQAQILDLLRDIKNKFDGSIMLITHDLGVIAEMADEVVVMYAGKIVEKGMVNDIFSNPLHPYTVALQKSKPMITDDGQARLFTIPGQVPNPVDMPNNCYFKDRCPKCTDKCGGRYPDMVNVSPTHSVSCYLYGGGND